MCGQMEDRIWLLWFTLLLGTSLLVLSKLVENKEESSHCGREPELINDFMRFARARATRETAIGVPFLGSVSTLRIRLILRLSSEIDGQESAIKSSETAGIKRRPIEMSCTTHEQGLLPTIRVLLSAGQLISMDLPSLAVLLFVVTFLQIVSLMLMPYINLTHRKSSPVDLYGVENLLPVGFDVLIPLSRLPCFPYILNDSVYKWFDSRSVDVSSKMRSELVHTVRTFLCGERMSCWVRKVSRAFRLKVRDRIFNSKAAIRHFVHKMLRRRVGLVRHIIQGEPTSSLIDLFFRPSIPPVGVLLWDARLSSSTARSVSGSIVVTVATDLGARDLRAPANLFPVAAEDGDPDTSKASY